MYGMVGKALEEWVAALWRDRSREEIEHRAGAAGHAGHAVRRYRRAPRGGLTPSIERWRDGWRRRRFERYPTVAVDAVRTVRANRDGLLRERA